jgi:hypothetical protein
MSEEKQRQRTDEECGECGARLLADRHCLRCAPPVIFQPEWLDGGPDIVERAPHERRQKT